MPLSESPLASTRFALCFASLKDPRRVQGRLRHRLLDLLLIGILAVIAGADSFEEMGDFAQLRKEWLVTWLDLKNGVPSADTFWRVFSLINPKCFFACYAEFVDHLRTHRKGEVIAFDGKTLRGTRKSSMGVLHLVRAWATDSGLVLAQEASEAKTNELAALLTLIRQLNLEGTVATIDAAGTYVEVAQAVVDQQGDYALTVKANQRNLHEAIALRFLSVSKGQEDSEVKVATITEEAHGRKETRTLWIAAATSVPETQQWPKVQTIAAIRRVREVNGAVSEEWRYILSSCVQDNPGSMLTIVRSHWSIENQLHWILDVAFHEDQSRILDRRAQQNLSTLRVWALTLIKQTPRRAGVARTRKMAGWSAAVLEAILLGEKIGK